MFGHLAGGSVRIATLSSEYRSIAIKYITSTLRSAQPQNSNFLAIKDYILTTQNHTMFMEQLNITLTNELIDMNDSTHGTPNLSVAAEA